MKFRKKSVIVKELNISILPGLVMVIVILIAFDTSLLLTVER